MQKAIGKALGALTGLFLLVALVGAAGVLPDEEKEVKRIHIKKIHQDCAEEECEEGKAIGYRCRKTLRMRKANNSVEQTA